MGQISRVQGQDVSVPMSWVIEAVSGEFGVSRAELRGDVRSYEVARPRQCAYWLGRLAGHSTPMIGRALNKDHTSVIHGSRRHVQEMQKSDEYRARCERLRLAMVRHGNGDPPPYLPLICSGGKRLLPGEVRHPGPLSGRASRPSIPSAPEGLPGAA